MAELVIHSKRIRENINKLSRFFQEKDIEWSLITKVFSGDREFLEHIVNDKVLSGLHSMGDSRLTSLKNLKSVNPNMRTIYIKPPAVAYADDVVAYADVSLNSSFKTIQALNEAARKAGKIHQVIIMIELGELREGILREDILDFYGQVFELDNINVVGIGSNLGCMYGVEPNYDKLMQLALYKELISAKFNVDVPLVSGGTSITLPLLEKDQIPTDINHFRNGEAAFFGISPLDNQQFLDLHTDTFEFRANIIELEEKRLVPEGVISEANIGHTAGFEDYEPFETTTKAILDFGMLDVDKADLDPYDKDISFVGITSDMMVLDLGENKTDQGKKKYSIGDQIVFKPNYMAVARLLNSKFIDRSFID